MNNKILFVDDEVNVLNAYKRSLRRQFHMDTAEGGADGIEMIRSRGPYAVIVSDMRMPNMNGIQFLATAKALAPNTVRMMLTGNADQQTAIDAINNGDILRFMTKPCPPEALARSLQAGIDQYRLLTAEKELLEKTLKGSIRALTDVMALVNPDVFGRTVRLKNTMCQIGERIGLAKTWWLETLAALSQVGAVILPESAVKKLSSGEKLTPEENKAFKMYPSVGADLIADIPRMAELAEAIRYQRKNYDGTGLPQDDVRGEAIPEGSRILRVVLDFDTFLTSGLNSKQAFARMEQHLAWYDPKVLAALRSAIDAQRTRDLRTVTVSELTDEMMFAESVRTTSGVMLVCKGYEATPVIRRRLAEFADHRQLREPLSVWIWQD